MLLTIILSKVLTEQMSISTRSSKKATSAEVQEAVNAFMEIADISISGSESVGNSVAASDAIGPLWASLLEEFRE